MELPGNATAEENDTLKVDVGGVRMVCKRSILIVLHASKLAKIFSGRWDKNFLRDSVDRIFLGVNPACFKKILDYICDITS